MITSQRQFANETVKFFHNTNFLLEDAIPRGLLGEKEFIRLIDETFDFLSKEINLGAQIMEALMMHQREEGRMERKDGFDFLYLEMVYFNTRYNYVDLPEQLAPALAEISPKEKVESASIVLGSVQELLSKLPKWLQNVIKVIGEILGIAKALIGK